MRRAKRLGRYLVGKARVVTEYPWQSLTEKIEGYSDSDWAGCQRTAKSTSSGVLMRGMHFLWSWSSTQKCVTLSSGEAELLAAVRASTEVFGILQLVSDWGGRSADRRSTSRQYRSIGRGQETRLWQAQACEGWRSLDPRKARGGRPEIQQSKRRGQSGGCGNQVSYRGETQEAHGIC